MPRVNPAASHCEVPRKHEMCYKSTFRDPHVSRQWRDDQSKGKLDSFDHKGYTVAHE